MKSRWLIFKIHFLHRKSQIEDRLTRYLIDVAERFRATIQTYRIRKGYWDGYGQSRYHRQPGRYDRPGGRYRR